MRPRTSPILRAEGEDGEALDAPGAAAFDGAGERERARRVTRSRGQALPPRPAGVAVEDDAHVPRQGRGAKRGRARPRQPRTRRARRGRPPLLSFLFSVFSSFPKLFLLLWGEERRDGEPEGEEGRAAAAPEVAAEEGRGRRRRRWRRRRRRAQRGRLRRCHHCLRRRRSPSGSLRGRSSAGNDDHARARRTHRRRGRGTSHRCCHRK